MTKYVYVLRSDEPSGVSYGGFVWPEQGPVEAPDWDPTPKCGGGLHGLLWGCGDATLLYKPDDPATRWRVVKVPAAGVVDLTGKVKFRAGEVVFCGDRDGALAVLDKKGAADKPVVYAVRAAGYRGSATAGYRGSATAGYRGSATAGYEGSATAGVEGSATAGDRGSATAGHWGSATAGYGGTASAGDRGTIQIKWWDGDRYRIATGYVGEGIDADVPYRCTSDGQLVKANP